MKFARVLVTLVVVASPIIMAANQEFAAERAWEPFFESFREAVWKRDRQALRRMMSADFFSCGGNDPGPDAAFSYWDREEMWAWQSFDAVLEQGAVPMSSWWFGGRPENPGRVSPPSADIEDGLQDGDWYAIFEFRWGRWYCTVFVQCCD